MLFTDCPQFSWKLATNYGNGYYFILFLFLSEMKSVLHLQITTTLHSSKFSQNNLYIGIGKFNGNHIKHHRKWKHNRILCEWKWMQMQPNDIIKLHLWNSCDSLDEMSNISTMIHSRSFLFRFRLRFQLFIFALISRLFCFWVNIRFAFQYIFTLKYSWTSFKSHYSSFWLRIDSSHLRLLLIPKHGLFLRIVQKKIHKKWK